MLNSRGKGIFKELGFHNSVKFIPHGQAFTLTGFVPKTYLGLKSEIANPQSGITQRFIDLHIIYRIFVKIKLSEKFTLHSG
jgi:hypothetical protein